MKCTSYLCNIIVMPSEHYYNIIIKEVSACGIYIEDLYIKKGVVEWTRSKIYTSLCLVRYALWFHGNAGYSGR